MNKSGPKKPDAVIIDLDCSLPELYNGCVKSMCIARQRYNDSQILSIEYKTFQITVKPGWKKGTKVTFVGEGDEGVDISPPDIVFVITEVPSSNSDLQPYIRDGNNLIYTYKINLSDALTDCSLRIPTLDNRLISLAAPEVISPYYEKLIVGEGMPISKQPGSKGDLILKFHILFPKYLNGQKRIKIKELLGSLTENEWLN